MFARGAGAGGAPLDGHRRGGRHARSRRSWPRIFVPLFFTVFARRQKMGEGATRRARTRASVAGAAGGRREAWPCRARVARRLAAARWSARTTSAPRSSLPAAFTASPRRGGAGIVGAAGWWTLYGDAAARRADADGPRAQHRRTLAVARVEEARGRCCARRTRSLVFPLVDRDAQARSRAHAQQQLRHGERLRRWGCRRRSRSTCGGGCAAASAPRATTSSSRRAYGRDTVALTRRRADRAQRTSRCARSTRSSSPRAEILEAAEQSLALATKRSDARHRSGARRRTRRAPARRSRRAGEGGRAPARDVRARAGRAHRAARSRDARRARSPRCRFRRTTPPGLPSELLERRPDVKPGRGERSPRPPSASASRRARAVSRAHAHRLARRAERRRGPALLDRRAHVVGRRGPARADPRRRPLSPRAREQAEAQARQAQAAYEARGARTRSATSSDALSNVTLRARTPKSTCAIARRAIAQGAAPRASCATSTATRPTSRCSTRSAR